MKDEIIYNLKDWKGFVSKFNDHFAKIGKVRVPFSIVFKKLKKSPTHPMRSYYWSVIIKLAKNELKKLGNNFDSQETHCFLKDMVKFYKIEPVFLKDKEFYKKVHKTISFKGNMKGTFEYFELIKQWCAENLDLYIPDPDKNWRKNDN